MANLSRRSLLTGLLSSAAVIAAGPVAKIVVVDDGFGIGPAMQALPTLEDYAAMINRGIFDHDVVIVDTFPRNSRAGMTFRLLE